MIIYGLVLEVFSDKDKINLIIMVRYLLEESMVIVLKTMIKLTIYIAVIFFLSYLFVSMVHLTGPLGSKITEVVTEYRGAPVNLDSEYADLSQAITLTIFFTVIVVTIIKMEWRVAAAISGIGILVMSAIVPPQDLVVKAIDWRLLLFLIGSMTLAGVLRETGVFNRLAILLLSKSESSLGLLMLLGIFSAVLSMVLDEVSSIIYAVMVVLELKRVMRIDLKPLIIFAVLATNTGSIALPVGNPIGVYIAFTANVAVSEFIVKCLTLSLLELMVLVLLFKLVLRDYTKALDQELKQSKELISKLSLARTIDVSRIGVKRFKTGVFILIFFVALVVSSEHLANLMSILTGVSIDPHALLAFIPFFSIAMAIFITDPSSINKLIESAVEWPTMLFFIALFILSYSLSYTGAIAKIAYVIASVSSLSGFEGNAITANILLISSAVLSSVLDNLSVIVTLMQPVKVLVQLGLSRVSYFSLLYGGVFGGNYTPIGSTANIVAVSMAEREKMGISWSEWLKIALISTTIQIIIAVVWSDLWLLIEY